MASWREGIAHGEGAQSGSLILKYKPYADVQVGIQQEASQKQCHGHWGKLFFWLFMLNPPEQSHFGSFLPIAGDEGLLAKSLEQE